jgi:RNA polymerase sigma-70 factor (sigma-E family)
LLRAAFVLTGDQHSAEDLVQSVLERVATSWRRIETSPDAYAKQVMYRIEARRWQRPSLAIHVTPSPPERSVADLTGEVDTRLALEAALRRLTGPQRAVLVARFYDDMTEAQAAAALGCSVGTIKSQTHKALYALREAAPDLAELVGRSVTTDV